MATGKIILYGIVLSPPVRAVLLTLKALDLEYEFREINLQLGEHMTPEYLKKNPQHTVPTLEDVDGKIICDSHAICAYLVRKYGKDDEDKMSLYPKDYFERAKVDHRLHFESGVLFAACLKTIIRQVFNENVQEIPKQTIVQILEAYTTVETMLGEHPFVAGDNVTIADFSCVATLSVFNLALPTVDASQWPKLSAWFERMSQLPYYEEANGKGATAIAAFLSSKLPKDFEEIWQEAVADIKSGKK